MNNKTAFASSRRAGVVLCIPLIAGVLVFYAIPMAMLLWHSLRTPGGSFCGLQNYKELLCNPAFQLAAQNTAVLWAVSLPVDLGVGMLFAQLWNLCSSGIGLCWLMFPAMVPAACSIAFGKLAVFRIFGANEMAQAHLFSFIVFLYLWKTVGFTALVLQQKIRSIPLELSETAADLGAAPLQIFFKIQLPILIPAIADSLAIALLGGFRLFREAYLLAGPHPQGRLYSLQHFYYNNFANLNAPRLAAASILQTVMIALFAALLFRRDSRHETHK